MPSRCVVGCTLHAGSGLVATTAPATPAVASAAPAAAACVHRQRRTVARPIVTAPTATDRSRSGTNGIR